MSREQNKRFLKARKFKEIQEQRKMEAEKADRWEENMRINAIAAGKVKYGF